MAFIPCALSVSRHRVSHHNLDKLPDLTPLTLDNKTVDLDNLNQLSKSDDVDALYVIPLLNDKQEHHVLINLV